MKKREEENPLRRGSMRKKEGEGLPSRSMKKKEGENPSRRPNPQDGEDRSLSGSGTMKNGRTTMTMMMTTMMMTTAS